MKISYNKSKAVKLLCISIVFVAMGLYFIIHPEEFNRYSTVFTQFLGVITLCFFSLGIFVSIKMFFQKTPRFEINWEGITYDVKESSTFIAWNEIESFSELKIYNQLMILIHVRDPKDYIAREKNLIKRKLMEFNYNKYNAPISILPSMYNISIDQLKANLERHFLNKYSI